MGFYSSKEVGQLIKKYRLDKHLSQENLCKNICGISYLSKIEAGLVEASEDIIIQLFNALDIIYITDDTFLSEGKSILNAFFKSYFFNYFNESCRLFSQLQEKEDKYLCSPLMVDYLLAKAYHFSSDVSSSILLQLIDELASYENTFSSYQQYHFLYIKGFVLLHYTKDISTALQKLSYARSLQQTASILTLMAECYFRKGEYPLALDKNEEAFRLAIDDGNIFCALSICILQANIYSHMSLTSLMLKYYNRALNLCEGIGDIDYKRHIYYNLGTTYLTLKDYPNALSYCLQSLALHEMEQLHNVSLYHKLALIYLETQDKEKAQSYINLASIYLKEDEQLMATCMDKVLDWIAIRIKDPYYLCNEAYLHLLEVIYETIDTEMHFDFKQFYGDYLISCYKANRRYKDALRVTEELYVNTRIFPKSSF